MRIQAIILILAIGGCAGEPASPSAPAQSATAATAPAGSGALPATAAVARVAPGTPPAATLKKAALLGFQARVRHGTTMYCRDYAKIGSNIPEEHCFSANDLDEIVRQSEASQDLMGRPSGCAAACGGHGG